MRIGTIAILAGAFAFTGCDQAGSEQETVPPPPELLPPEAGAPPPVAPPPKVPLCPPFPPGFEAPDDAPTQAECDAWKARQEAEAKVAEKRMLAEAKRDGDLKPFDQRTDPFPERGSWIQQLEPTRNGVCRFTEKPRSERPRRLVVQAHSGNMDLLADGFVLGHDHAIGFVEAMWMEDKPVIAVRKGLPDLWIEPLGDRSKIVLRIGAEEFICVRWGED